MAFAIEAVWPLLLDTIYFFTCRNYPFATITIVMWMGKNIPELVKSHYTAPQEDVDDANLQQAVPPNRGEGVPTNQQSDTEPSPSTSGIQSAVSTSGLQPAVATSGFQPAVWTSGLQPAASLSIQESVVQRSRTFTAATQAMLEGISPPGTERSRAMTAVLKTVRKSSGSTAMIERTSVSKIVQKTKRGTLSGGSSSAPLSRSA